LTPLSSLALGTFGLLALALAATGIYGIVAYGVARRTAELGIRAALGATPASILALVLRGGLTPVLIGVGVGLVAVTRRTYTGGTALRRRADRSGDVCGRQRDPDRSSRGGLYRPRSSCRAGRSDHRASQRMTLILNARTRRRIRPF
jgi:hypothetical protein